MRVLLTRAAEDAARTRDKLEAAGHSVLLSPMIEIETSVVHWPRGVVDALVATSAHAFAAPLDGLAEEARRLLPLCLVGARTESAARGAGFMGPVLCERTAADLIAALETREPWPRRVTYLAGEDRKADLESAFAERGSMLELHIAYAARPSEGLSAAATEALGRGAVDGILHFSRRSAELCLDACEKAGVDAGRPVHFCMSEDVAAGLQTRGDFDIKVAESPTEAGLLALFS